MFIEKNQHTHGVLGKVLVTVFVLTVGGDDVTEEQPGASSPDSSYGSFHSSTSIRPHLFHLQSCGLISVVVSFVHRVATDHNQDNTSVILRHWLVKVQNFYHYVEWRPKEEPT